MGNGEEEIVMGLWAGIGFGCAGGILAEIFKWWAIRDEIVEKGLPDRFKTKLYWGSTIAMILAGGFIVFVHMYSGAVLNAYLAINVGAVSPLIISKLIQGGPSVSPGRVN